MQGYQHYRLYFPANNVGLVPETWEVQLFPFTEAASALHCDTYSIFFYNKNKRLGAFPLIPTQRVKTACSFQTLIILGCMKSYSSRVRHHVKPYTALYCKDFSLYIKEARCKIQCGSNMTGTDLCVNKPHCAAAVRP